MNAADMAGHENQVERQVIIDKENPVIVHVDELDGKYLKYFRWDYSAGESVKDFTSYTYTMKLDDTVYRPGEKIEKEGMHTLVVEAVDSAGNKSDAKARFTIDHTPPVIRFENIREGTPHQAEQPHRDSGTAHSGGGFRRGQRDGADCKGHTGTACCSAAAVRNRHPEPGCAVRCGCNF